MKKIIAKFMTQEIEIIMWTKRKLWVSPIYGRLKIIDRTFRLSPGHQSQQTNYELLPDAYVQDSRHL